MVLPVQVHGEVPGRQAPGVSVPAAVCEERGSSDGGSRRRIRVRRHRRHGRQVLPWQLQQLHTRVGRLFCGPGGSAGGHGGTDDVWEEAV